MLPASNAKSAGRRSGVTKKLKAMYLLIFLLATAGLTTIVTKSLLMKPFRDFFKLNEERLNDYRYNNVKLRETERVLMFFHKLFTCSLCFGVWAGALLYWIMQYEWGYWFGCACAGSAVAFIYDRITDRL
jgi:hypothetical protein